MFILLSKDGVALLIQVYSPVSQFYTRVHESNKYLINYGRQSLVLVLIHKFIV